MHLYATVERPMGSRNSSAVPVRGKAEHMQPRMPTRRNVVKSSSGPRKSAVACAGWSGRLGSRAIRWWPGLKKAAELPPLSETVITPDATNPASTTLELDELWSFVARKIDQAWIWIALCRESRQVVAYAVGDRSQSTCRRLWEAIPFASSYWPLFH